MDSFAAMPLPRLRPEVTAPPDFSAQAVPFEKPIDFSANAVPYEAAATSPAGKFSQGYREVATPPPAVPYQAPESPVKAFTRGITGDTTPPPPASNIGTVPPVAPVTRGQPVVRADTRPGAAMFANPPQPTPNASQGPDERTPVTPSVVDAATRGFNTALHELGQGGAAVSGGAPDTATAVQGPETQQIKLGDLTDPSLLAAKIAYQLAKGSPTIAAGIGGTAAGAAVGGPIGGIAAGSIAAGAAAAAQALGPAYAAGIKAGLSPDAAYDAAVKQASQSGAFSAVGWAAFGWTPFNTLAKNILFQAFGVQQVVGAGEKVITNVQTGQPLGSGIADDALGTALMTVVPLTALHGIKVLSGEEAPGAEPATGPERTAPPEPPSSAPGGPSRPGGTTGAAGEVPANPPAAAPAVVAEPPAATELGAKLDFSSQATEFDANSLPTSPETPAVIAMPDRSVPAKVEEPPDQRSAPDREQAPAPAPTEAEALAAVDAEHAKQVLADPAIADHLAADRTIDRSHDIPYLAGYAKDGTTIFVDKSLPDTVEVNGRQIDPLPFLLTHESVEKALIDVRGYTYSQAHDVATAAEHADLVAAGIDPAAYEKALAPIIQAAQTKPLTSVPATLDLTPYQQTNAKALQTRMAAATGAASPPGPGKPPGKPSAPSLPTVTRLAAAARPPAVEAAASEAEAMRQVEELVRERKKKQSVIARDEVSAALKGDPFATDAKFVDRVNSLLRSGDYTDAEDAIVQAHVQAAEADLPPETRRAIEDAITEQGASHPGGEDRGLAPERGVGSAEGGTGAGGEPPARGDRNAEQGGDGQAVTDAEDQASAPSRTEGDQVVVRKNAKAPLARTEPAIRPDKSVKVERVSVAAIEKPGVSKIGKSIETKAVEAKLTNGFSETAGYDPITIQDQAEKATTLVNSDITKAREVIRGDTPLPAGLRGTALITAMEVHLKDHPSADMAYELANSPLVSATSAAAQELRLAAERVPDSITAKFQAIRDARLAAVEKRTGGSVKKATKEITRTIRKQIQKTASKKSAWMSFVDSIAC